MRYLRKEISYNDNKCAIGRTRPALGTVLGNLGINAVKFCKEFNEFTQDLPNYFRLPVIIWINENKNYSYSFKGPQLGDILYLLKEELESGEEFIDLFELVKVAKFKFPDLPLEKSVSIIFGTLASTNLFIKEEQLIAAEIVEND